MRPRNSEDHSKHWIIWLNMTHFWCQIHDWLARLELQATFCHQPEMLRADDMCLLSNGDRCDQRAFFRAIHPGGSPTTTSCAWHTDVELVVVVWYIHNNTYTTIHPSEWILRASLQRLQKRWLVLQGKHSQTTCVWCSRISKWLSQMHQLWIWKCQTDSGPCWYCWGLRKSFNWKNWYGFVWTYGTSKSIG